MIELDNVRFRYEEMDMVFALRVEAGTFAAIIGPSGSGKSTLLSLIAGFEYPLSGTIRIGGEDMTRQPPAARPVNMIFQDHNVFAHLDAWNNVALGLSPSLRLGPEDRRHVDDALARVGLAGMARRRPGELSGGERQRIAIARALVRRKPVLLLDEPFAALGPRLRQNMLDLLVDLHRERQLTVLLVSHDPEDARRAASLTALLADGRIVAYRPTAQLFAATDLPELRDYLGRPLHPDSLTKINK